MAEVEVTGDSAEMVKEDLKFKDWLNKVQDGGLVITQIVVSGAIFTFNSGLLFALVRVFASYHQKPIRFVAFIRGDAVAVLVVLKDEYGEEWVVLTKQSRFPVGQTEFVEIPAGMLDQQTGQFTSVAIKKILEETGLTVTARDFQPLGSYYSSPGGSDEEVILYYVVLRMTSTQIGLLCKKYTGNTGEHEAITLLVVPLYQVPEVASKDPKALVAWARYKGFMS